MGGRPRITRNPQVETKSLYRQGDRKILPVLYVEKTRAAEYLWMWPNTAYSLTRVVVLWLLEAENAVKSVTHDVTAFISRGTSAVQVLPAISKALL